MAVSRLKKRAAQHKQPGGYTHAEPRRGGQRRIRTGEWIKQFLLREGEATIGDMRNILKDELKAKNMRPPSYHSFYRYFQSLRRLGLVEASREEPAIPEQFIGVRATRTEGIVTAEIATPVRVYYRLTSRGEAEDAAWLDPINAIYNYPKEVRSPAKKI